MPRDLLATALEDGLPNTFHLERIAQEMVITTETVMVRIDEVTRHPQVAASARRYVFTVIVLAPTSDELDAALEDVLRVIEDAPELPQWTKATRATFGDDTPAYEVEIPFDLSVTAPATP